MQVGNKNKRQQQKQKTILVENHKMLSIRAIEHF